MRVFLLLLAIIPLIADEVEQLPYGNFAVPASQQPAPLVSFGQLILGKDVLQVLFDGNHFWGPHTGLTEFAPGLLYGISDRMSAIVFAPFLAENRQFDQSGAGMEDVLVELEYAYYSHNTETYTNGATVVGMITFPSGTPFKEPPTGFGAPSLFIGGTFSHMDRRQYLFFCPGALFPLDSEGTRFGKQFLYEFGYQHVIYARSGQLLFAGMVELDGVYSGRNRIRSVTNPNSGGNVIWLTPSLWLSTKRWIVQGGLSFPLLEHLNGNQPKYDVGLYFAVSLTL
ncbi:MAG: hypothetical protein AB7F31_06875 [Parachlamydiales bacterium]